MWNRAKLDADLEEGFWQDRGVQMFDVDLAYYVQALRRATQLRLESDGT